jgi:hypothetical protein
LVVLQSNGQKLRVPKDSIEDVTPTKKSAMPENLLNALSLEEIADLFAFLGESPRAQITSRRGASPR